MTSVLMVDKKLSVSLKTTFVLESMALLALAIYATRAAGESKCLFLAHMYSQI